MSFTSAVINPLTSPFPPQYPEARLGELTNNWPTVPELPTGSKLSFKMYAPEFITGCPIGTYISIYNYFVGHKGGNNIFMSKYFSLHRITLFWSSICSSRSSTERKTAKVTSDISVEP